MRRQEPPFCVQIELVLGCNLQCGFCGLNGIQARPNENLRPMTVETADLVARRLAEAVREYGWNPRLEFARRGEPSMHPLLAEVIDVFRRQLPKLQIMVTSNGGGFLR